jgi:hypothetical protein
MARAAHSCSIFYTGTTTATAGEVCSVVAGTGGLIYQITDSARRIIDPNVGPTVYDNAVDVTSAVALNYLFGRITFGGAPTTPVRIDCNFLPRHEITKTREFSISMSADVPDTTALDTAGFREKVHGLLDASGSLTVLDVGLTDFGGDSLAVWLLAQDSKVLEFNLVDEIVRTWAVIESVEPSGSVDGVVELSVGWSLNAQLSGAVAFGFIAA